MRAIPVAMPPAWTLFDVFDLQSIGFRGEPGSDCLRYRKAFR